MLGVGNRLLGNFETSLDYCNAWLALSLKKYGENHSSTSNAYRELGNIYLDMSKVDEAIEYLNKSVNIARKLPDVSRDDLVIAYCDLGQAYHRSGKYAEALESLQKANEISEIENLFMPEIIQLIGRVYRDTRDTARALKFFLKALQDQKEKDHLEAASIYIDIAQVYQILQDPMEALLYLINAWRSKRIITKMLKP